MGQSLFPRSKTLVSYQKEHLSCVYGKSKLASEIFLSEAWANCVCTFENLKNWEKLLCLNGLQFWLWESTFVSCFTSVNVICNCFLSSWNEKQLLLKVTYEFFFSSVNFDMYDCTSSKWIVTKVTMFSSHTIGFTQKFRHIFGWIVNVIISCLLGDNCRLS